MNGCAVHTNSFPLLYILGLLILHSLTSYTALVDSKLSVLITTVCSDPITSNSTLHPNSPTSISESFDRRVINVDLIQTYSLGKAIDNADSHGRFLIGSE